MSAREPAAMTNDDEPIEFTVNKRDYRFRLWENRDSAILSIGTPDGGNGVVFEAAELVGLAGAALAAAGNILARQFRRQLRGPQEP